MQNRLDPTSLPDISDLNNEEFERLARRTVPLGGMAKLIAAIVIVGLLYNGGQKLNQFLKTKFGAKTVAPAKPAQNNANTYYYPGYSPVEKKR